MIRQKTKSMNKVVRKTSGAAGVASRRALTEKEISELLKQARIAGGEWFRLFAFALYAGLRLNDCVRIDWEDVDLGKSVVNFRPAMRRRSVEIKFGAALHKELSGVRVSNRHGRIFPTIGPMLEENRVRVSAMIREIFTKAGLKYSVGAGGFTFHALRSCYLESVK